MNIIEELTETFSTISFKKGRCNLKKETIKKYNKKDFHAFKN